MYAYQTSTPPLSRIPSPDKLFSFYDAFSDVLSTRDIAMFKHMQFGDVEYKVLRNRHTMFWQDVFHHPVGCILKFFC